MIFIWLFKLVLANSAVKFFNDSGIQIRRPSDLSNFVALLPINRRKLFLNANNHEYITDINFFEDPCYYKLEGIFDRSLGYFDVCENYMQFFHRKNLYSLKIKPDDAIENSQAYSQPEYLSRTIYNYFKPQNLPYKIDVFILNDSNRTLTQGNSVNKETLQIFEKVRDIFKDSGMDIEPRISGILNLRSKIDYGKNREDALHAFKALIEPTRFSPFNLTLPLAKSDLVVLLAQLEGPGNPESDKVVHGISFYGGAARLDSSYSVVFTKKSDSQYFIAKKIAHEIGHSLGAVHGTMKSIMEKSTCEKCDDEKRIFDTKSKEQINKFIRINQKIFTTKETRKYSEHQTLKSLKEAEEYAEERRKHGLLEIIKNRLQGKIPVTLDSESTMIVSLLFYTFVVIALLLYWK